MNGFASADFAKAKSIFLTEENLFQPSFQNIHSSFNSLFQRNNIH